MTPVAWGKKKTHVNLGSKCYNQIKSNVFVEAPVSEVVEQSAKCTSLPAKILVAQHISETDI